MRADEAKRRAKLHLGKSTITGLNNGLIYSAVKMTST